MKKLIICLTVILINSCSFKKDNREFIFLQRECQFYEIIEDHFLHDLDKELRKKIGGNNTSACLECENIRNSQKCKKILKEYKRIK